MMSIDTTNMCSHLQRKLFEEDGIYHSLWVAMQDDPDLIAVVRSRQLHIYRNGKKILVLGGKSAPRIIRADRICSMLPINYAIERSTMAVSYGNRTWLMTKQDDSLQV